MTVRISLPDGTEIQTETVQEAVEVARVFVPSALNVIADTRLVPEKRTRRSVTNGDLLVMDAWGLNSVEARMGLTYDDWRIIAGELNRSVTSTQSLTQRYLWGVYESSGSDPAARAIVHGDRDRSRSKA